MSQLNIDDNKFYCTGCGLCTMCDCKIAENEDGFFVLDTVKDKDIFLKFASQVCPVSGELGNDYCMDSIWGKYEEVYLGWSSDSTIRHKASSGGVLTALRCFLLDMKLVDVIIQGAVSNTSTIRTEKYISFCSSDVLKCMGSRYTISSPLVDFKEILTNNRMLYDE